MTQLRVKILYFADGIPALEGRLSVAADDTPGVPTADSIRRIATGYLIGWKGRLHFVPDARVVSALVEEIEDEPAEPRKLKAKA